MVYYMDGVVGEMVAALKTKSMWENTLWVHQSDNGGPSFTGSSHTANNYPQKGSKMSNWQGGIRVNAFVSGGLIQAKAPKMVGKKLDGFTHACDW
jgi:arylsulfatase B